MDDALTITPCVTIQWIAIAHGFGDEIADPLGSIEQRGVVQMRVPRCRLQSGMAEKLANHRQGFRPGSGMAGKTVAQIVQPHTKQSGLGLDLSPEAFDVTHRPLGEFVPEYGVSWPTPFKRREQNARFLAKPDSARSGFAVVEQESAPLDLSPRQVCDFGTATTGQKQHVDNDCS
jgi:hypothetical protein